MTAKRILVIDDEYHLCVVVQACLENLGGWTVAIATSGAEGLEQAEAEPPDAILMDVMMPDMDGPTLFQSLQSNPATKTIPVIFLTAKVQSGDRSNLQQLGVAGVIAKPFDPLKLADQVTELLGW
jgi:CheY-like chemotaxis protein